jgi:hypothetical protein
VNANSWAIGSTKLSGRQINLALEFLLVTAILSGLASWATTDRWNGALTVIHGVSGISLVIMVPAKFRGPVRTGFRRRRATRWLSALFGVLILAALVLGVFHATGIWYGVGYLSALWAHELFGFSLIPLLVWHVVSRPIPVRSTAADFDRRALVKLGATAVAATALHVGQRFGADAVGLAGGTRRQTGSHEVGSHDPAQMPTVIWLNDHRPANTDVGDWSLQIDGSPISISDLWAQTVQVVAKLDCTGGWWSEQVWDAVSLSTLIPTPSGRSVYIESATGYGRRFPIGDLDDLYLAVGYGGQPLLQGHGAPVRLVVPGRRGPEWIKWTAKVECSDRPWWLQAPLPAS